MASSAATQATISGPITSVVSRRQPSTGRSAGGRPRPAGPPTRRTRREIPRTPPRDRPRDRKNQQEDPDPARERQPEGEAGAALPGGDEPARRGPADTAMRTPEAPPHRPAVPAGEHGQGERDATGRDDVEVAL